MGDEGLPLGSLAIVLKNFHPSFKPFRLEDVYLGLEYTDEEVDNAAKSIMGDYIKIPYNVDYVGELLKSKKILGLFNGKSEHGPRALGNRTITCDPTHPETYDLINGKLQRNDFMPFAPAVLDEDANRLFKVNKSQYTSEFKKLIREEVRRALKEGVTKAELKTMKGTVGWIANEDTAYDIPDSWPSYIVSDIQVVSFDEGAKEVLEYASNYGASPEQVKEMAAKLKKLKTMGNKFVLYGFEADLNLGVL